MSESLLGTGQSDGGDVVGDVLNDGWWMLEGSHPLLTSPLKGGRDELGKPWGRL